MSVITKPETTLCKFMRAVDALRADPDFDDADELQVSQWLAGNTPASHIGRALRSLGHEVSNTRIKEHRLNDCNCRVDA